MKQVKMPLTRAVAWAWAWVAIGFVNYFLGEVAADMRRDYPGDWHWLPPLLVLVFLLASTACAIRALYFYRIASNRNQ